MTVFPFALILIHFRNGIHVEVPNTTTSLSTLCPPQPILEGSTFTEGYLMHSRTEKADEI